MRVLTRGRVALVAALVAGTTALALPAAAGSGAGPAPDAAAVTTGPHAVHPGQPAGQASDTTVGVALGPAVTYVREPDGTVRRLR